jgi:cytoskeletal protein RodZ
MPGIGETLRETRMRRRIDMSEVEAATKIRGKYLRALENEEWDLLPGPTFVKSFLRTYAEYLGLDSRMLVEEYRQRFERVSTQELTPFATGLGPRGQRRRRRRFTVGPGLVLFVGAVILVGTFYVLGKYWPTGDENDEPNTVQDGGPPQGSNAAPTAAERRRERERRRRRREREQRREEAARRVNLRLAATGPVYVCLVDASGRQVIDEQTLQAGQRTRTFRSSRFRANFGNDNVRMIVNGRTFAVAPSSDPIGYELRPGRRPRRLEGAERPDCSS